MIGRLIQQDRYAVLKSAGPAAQWTRRAIEAGDPETLLNEGTRKAWWDNGGPKVHEALAMALAVDGVRLSSAAMQIGQYVDRWSNGNKEKLKLAFFYYQLGMMIADNVIQGEQSEDEEAIRRHVNTRVAYLSRSMPPRDVVSIYRAARDWRPGHAPSPWN
jgi:hypothetical protein